MRSIVQNICSIIKFFHSLLNRFETKTQKKWNAIVVSSDYTRSFAAFSFIFVFILYNFLEKSADHLVLTKCHKVSVYCILISKISNNNETKVYPITFFL